LRPTTEPTKADRAAWGLLACHLNEVLQLEATQLLKKLDSKPEHRQLTAEMWFEGMESSGVTARTPDGLRRQAMYMLEVADWLDDTSATCGYVLLPIVHGDA
jgi:hypothetical protein